MSAPPFVMLGGLKWTWHDRPTRCTRCLAAVHYTAPYGPPGTRPGALAPPVCPRCHRWWHHAPNPDDVEELTR